MIWRYSDDELMQQVALGSHKAFSRLFDQYSSYVLGYSARLLGDRVKADDVSQEVWMKVVKSAPQYKPQGKFLGWLMTMTRNTVMDSLRSMKLEFSQLEEVANENLVATDMENLLSQRNDLEIIKNIIESLPTSQRLVFVAWMTESPSYEHLAEEFSTSVSAIKSLLFRARKTIMLELERRKQ